MKGKVFVYARPDGYFDVSLIIKADFNLGNWITTERVVRRLPPSSLAGCVLELTKPRERVQS